MKAQAQRFTGTIVLAFAAAMILAGGAQAERPDDRAGALGVGATAGPDALERALDIGLGARATEPMPDAFERALNIELAAAAVRPDDRGTVRGPGIDPGPATTSSSLVSRVGFQWDDAAVGGAAVLGVLMLGAAVLLTIRHRGRVILP
jgi:hypothetical protein